MVAEGVPALQERRMMKWMSVGILAISLWACGPALPGEELAGTAGPALMAAQAGLAGAPVTPSTPGATPPTSVGVVPLTANASTATLGAAVDPQAVPQDPIPCLNTHPDAPTPATLPAH